MLACAWRRLYGFTKSVAWADTKFWGKLVVYVRYSTDFTDQENDGPFSSGLPTRRTAAPDTESGRCLLSYA